MWTVLVNFKFRFDAPMVRYKQYKFFRIIYPYILLLIHETVKRQKFLFSHIGHNLMKINITKPGIMLQILSFIISCILLISWPLFMMLFSGEGKIPFYLKILYYFGIGCPSVFILCYGITIIQLIRRRNPGIITMIPLYYFMVFYLIFFSYVAITLISSIKV